MATQTRLRPGSRVLLHLEIMLADGTLVLSSFDGDPLDLTLGDGTLAPGFEDLLIGLKPGTDERFLADGSELYGSRDEANIHWLPRSDFPADLRLEPGQVISFETPGGQEIAGILLEANAGRVRLDFNHPLSGRSLQIRARVLSVTDPSGAAKSP